MQSFPLIRYFTAQQTIAIDKQDSISALQFLADIENLIARLPELPVMINLCENRYHFLLAFSTALVKQQVMILPPDKTERTITELHATHKNCYIISDKELHYKQGIDQLNINHIDFKKFLKKQSFDIPLIPENQLAAILYTSGSSGNPKPNKKTWGSLVKGAELVSDRFNICSNHHIVATVPPQHMFGFETTVLLPMQAGLCTKNNTPLFPHEIVDQLEQLTENRILITTPLQLRACEAASADLSNSKLILSSTAPLDKQLANQLQQHNNCPVYEIYGSTETGAIATRKTAEEDTWLPLDKIIFHSKGSNWFVSGGHLSSSKKLSDQLKFIRDRFLLMGRDSDLIKIAGKRASLVNLNHQINEIRGVNEAVFFLPDSRPETTQRLTLIVVAPELTKKELNSQLKERFDNAFLPRPIIFVAKLPRTKVGKIQFSKLQSIYLNHQTTKQQR